MINKKNTISLSDTISPEFKTIEDLISKYTISSFSDDNKVTEYIKDFNIKVICFNIEKDGIVSSNTNIDRTVVEFEEKPFVPEYNDLCRLHYLVLKRKAINVLEFGSGFSTAIMADAMRILSTYFSDWVKYNVRCINPFHIYSIEEEGRFIDITLKRLSDTLKDFASISHSSIELITHDNRIATIYSKLPNISPDLIYIDGPSLYGTTTELNGLSFNSPVRMPISADVLRFEFLLEPGTLIVVDGRTNNARFLKTYLKRNWIYHHDYLNDVHYFELQETPLGIFNKKKIDFCLNNEWLL